MNYSKANREYKRLYAYNRIFDQDMEEGIKTDRLKFNGELNMSIIDNLY